ncbi:MAG: hypothetical protein ACM3X0_07410 [Bacteroidota bacterium]
MEQAAPKSSLNLHEAARLFATPDISLADAEFMLANAIERGELRANVKRWATEQWEGTRLPGNVIRLETFVELADLEAWRANRTAGGKVG